MKINWQYKNFEELTLLELYKIMALRQDVFIIEQDCPYLDADGNDIQALHILGVESEKLIAYARIIPPLEENGFVKFGRVIVAKTYRGKRIGEQLIQKTLKKIEQVYKDKNIQISAQYQLEKWYQNFGFKSVGVVYLEDDMPHIKMEKN